MFAFVSKIMFSISIPQQIFKFEMNIEDNLWMTSSELNIILENTKSGSVDNI
jgi:hypothetical protein